MNNIFHILKSKLRNKFFLSITICVMLGMVTMVSYSLFTYITNGYRASEMYISNLTYGIKIVNKQGSTSSINGKNVVVSPNTTVHLSIELASLNTINTYYSLQYKVTSGSGVVKYETTNTSVGQINTNGKTNIDVVIENNNSTSSTVEFNVSGGYIHEGSNKVALITGYNNISNEWIEPSDIKILAMTQTDSNGTITSISTTPTTGDWVLTSDCKGATVAWNNTTYKLEVTIQSTPATCTLNFKSPPSVDIPGTLAYQIYVDNAGGKSDASVNFATPSSTSGDLGLYYTAGPNLSYTEGGKVSYYYRGAVQNNFVKFGKNSSNQDLYWRIIRIDEDGNIRLIYNGTTTAQTGSSTQIGTSAFNTNRDQNAYVGYMYGIPGSTTYEAEHANTNNSAIKTTIDNWFAANMTEERSYLSEDSIYCNNRQMNDQSADGYGKLGYGTNKTSYGRYRLYSNKRPDYRCSQANDQFTTTTATKGNKKLTYPVGLITADETSFAGGVNGSANSNYYLNTAQNYWTLSPYYFYGNGSSLFSMYSNGYISNYNVNDGLGVRPTVSLKSNSEVLRGTGTPEQPYELK